MARTSTFANNRPPRPAQLRGGAGPLDTTEGKRRMRRVSMVQVNVTDLEKAQRFYCDLLGFGLQHASAQSLVLEHDGPTFVLRRVERPALADYPNAGRTLLVLHSDDIDADIRRLQAAGVVLLQPRPVASPMGRYIGFLDPFGNVHELLQPGAAATEGAVAAKVTGTRDAAPGRARKQPAVRTPRRTGR